MNHSKLRKHPKLEMVRCWEGTTGKYCISLPWVSSSLGDAHLRALRGRGDGR